MPTNNFPNIGYKTHGKDFNFFQKVTVSAVTFGGGSVDGYQPDLLITFSTQGLIFNIEGSGSNVVEYSFNGNTVHGELTQPTAGARTTLTFNNRVESLIWFRVKSGSTGPITISVEAWSIR